ncbi:MAG TPA: demethoxyubiquinone hydroxylase family protein [Alphaproteobacteria bacterium]|jgi:ubiquinone biosynthesis monooxygenase Coq7
MTDKARGETPSKPHRLPGDPDRATMVERMIRVDHAGEHGAVRIYQGQLAVLRHGPAARAIRHMADQEKAHLAAFDKLLIERRVRPTALSPLWDVAGFALGAASALLGPKAAMACTVAVEEVIEEHYRDQAETLGDDDPALKETISDFRDDEMAHGATALEYGAREAPLYEALSSVVKGGARLAIWLSTRV